MSEEKPKVSAGGRGPILRSTPLLRCSVCYCHALGTLRGSALPPRLGESSIGWAFPCPGSRPSPRSRTALLPSPSPPAPPSAQAPPCLEPRLRPTFLPHSPGCRSSGSAPTPWAGPHTPCPGSTPTARAVSHGVALGVMLPLPLDSGPPLGCGRSLHGARRYRRETSHHDPLGSDTPLLPPLTCWAIPSPRPPATSRLPLPGSLLPLAPGSLPPTSPLPPSGDLPFLIEPQLRESGTLPPHFTEKRSPPPPTTTLFLHRPSPGPSVSQRPFAHPLAASLCALSGAACYLACLCALATFTLQLLLLQPPACAHRFASRPCGCAPTLSIAVPGVRPSSPGCPHWSPWRPLLYAPPGQRFSFSFFF